MKKMLMCVLTIALLATFTFPAAGWNTVKVASTDMSVDKASFIDANTGWIVYSTTYPTKQIGLVQKTTDGGLNWTTVRPAEAASVDISWNDMEFIDANVGYACGKRGVIYKTTNGGTDWTMIGDTVTYKVDLYDLDVVSADVVYIAGKSGTMLKTINGITFTKLSYNFDGDMTYIDDTRDDLDGGIAFFNENRGVVAVDFTKEATIWWTEDGGTTWHPVKITSAFPTGSLSYRVYDVAVGGDSTVVLSGYYHTCLVSTNGGRTFVVKGPHSLSNVYSEWSKIIDNNTIITGGGSDNFLMKTTDGGINWDTLYVGTGQSFASADFIDANTGYIFNYYGQWFKTTDGGSTWNPLNSWPQVRFEGLAAPTVQKIVLTTWGGGEVTSSNNSGVTWSYPSNLKTLLDGNLWECEFISSTNGIIAGDGGVMNKTSDGANSWQAVENPMFTTGKGINALRYWNSDTVYAGGASGNLMRSYDGGATWTAGTAGTGTFYDICPITGTKVVAVAASGKYYTSTDGVTFTNAGTFGTKNLLAVEFRGNTGIVVAAGGTIYRTTVDNWTNLTSVYTEPSSKDLYDIEFVDNTTVYVVGAGGIILKSEDAGLTWASQVSPTTENLRKLRFASPKLWAAGDYGTILMNPVGALAGEYYIPKGTHEKGFATLGAAISSLNSLGTQAAVKFLVDDNLNELGTELIITRNDLTAETGVTIKPATGKTPTITITGFPTTGNHSKQGFTIENASFITIDGSNTEGGTTKDLTITGNDATNGAYIVGVIDNSDNVTIKNVNITVTNMTAGGTILGVDGYTGAPDKLWIENCNIGAADKTLTNGVALWGNAATTPVEAVVKDCNIYATRRGITTFYNKENAYINNNIAIVTPRADQSFYCGIYLTGFGAGDTSVIFNNRITAIGVNTTASKFAAGIAVYGNEGVFDIFNNFIATNTINTGAATTCRVYGIVFGSATWSGTANIYHNTIDIAPTNQTGIHAAIGTEVKSSATLNIFNNILSNRHDAANSYGIHWTNAPSASSVLTLDYNDIYMAGATAKAGLYNATECATLDAWKTASGQDANSKAKITNFVSASDLHLTGASIGDNDLACYRINWLLTDIDGDSRPEVTYMGADEGSTPLTVGIATNTSDLPTEFSLEQNYPNPFNPTTTIAFSLPKSTKVTLAVYNILGQQVAVLQNGFLEAGYYRMNFNASNLPSGMYIYRITANGYSNVKKMAIMK